MQYPIVSMAQLVTTPLQKAFARRYLTKGSITPLQLEEAIRKHAGHDEDTKVDYSQVSVAVAKVVAMDQKGKTVLEKVEPIFGNLETYFSENPNVERIYRSSNGKFIPGPAAVITKALVEGLKPPEFQRVVHARLQHENNWKADPYKVNEILLEEAQAWRRLELHAPKTLLPRSPPASVLGDTNLT